MRLFILITAVLVNSSLLAQGTRGEENVPPPPPAESPEEMPPAQPADSTAFDVVEQTPEFPGDDNAFRNYVNRNLRYPAEEKDAEIQGTVYMQFVVERDGSITEIKVLRGISKGLDKEAERLIKSMPRWKPGKIHGKPVRTRVIYPVKFRLQ